MVEEIGEEEWNKRERLALAQEARKGTPCRAINTHPHIIVVNIRLQGIYGGSE